MMTDLMKNGQLLQFIKFSIVGASNAIVSYVLYVLFLLLFDYLQWFEGIDYIVAQYTSFFLSILWSYYWNNKYVFEKNGKWYWSLLKMILVYSITGIILSTILLYVMIEILNIHKLIAPIINIAIGLPINYALNKKWAFR